MPRYRPSDALKLLSNEQLRRIIDNKESIRLADSESCPLAIALDHPMTGGISFQVELSYVAPERVDDAYRVQEIGSSFIKWFDYPGRGTSNAQRVGQVVTMAKHIVRQRETSDARRTS